MIRTKTTRMLALAGLVPACKLDHSYRSLLPVLALCLATAAWSQTAPDFRGGRVPPSVFGGAQGAKPAAPRPARSQYRFISIEIPGSTGSCGYDCDSAFGVNDAWLVTGQCNVGSTSYGFAWQNGILHTLDYPGATDTHLELPNNRGVVAGLYANGVPNTYYAVTYSLLRNPARLSAGCRYFASSTAAILRDCNSDSTACPQ